MACTGTITATTACWLRWQRWRILYQAVRTKQISGRSTRKKSTTRSLIHKGAWPEIFSGSATGFWALPTGRTGVFMLSSSSSRRLFHYGICWVRPLFYVKMNCSIRRLSPCFCCSVFLFCKNLSGREDALPYWDFFFLCACFVCYGQFFILFGWSVSVYWFCGFSKSHRSGRYCLAASCL